MFDFDGPNQLVIMRPGAVELDSIDLYSRWKEWVVLSDNAKFSKAFEIVGGDPTSPTNRVPTFLFTVNGWKIRPQEADHTLTITGNLANEGGIGSPFVPTLGSFQVVLDKNTSTAPTVSVNTGSGVTPADITAIAAAVWTYTTRVLTSAGAGGATAQEVWEYATRELTSAVGVSTQNISDIADAVWDEVLSEHTGVGTTGEQLGNTSVNVDTGAIANAVWTNVSRTLTESAGVTAQDIVDISNAVWSEATRTLTQSPVSGVDYNNIADIVWDTDLSTHINAGSAGRVLGDTISTIDTSAIAASVWGHATRSLTSDVSLEPAQVTAIANAVWAVTVRTLTEDVELTTSSVNTIRDVVWGATSRTLTQATTISSGDIATIRDAVWSATTREITGEVVLSVADITSIRDAVWAATVRELTTTTTDLTSAQVNAIRDAVWLSTSRTLTDNLGLETDERAQLFSLPDADAIASAVLNTVAP